MSIQYKILVLGKNVNDKYDYNYNTKPAFESLKEIINSEKEFKFEIKKAANGFIEVTLDKEVTIDEALKLAFLVATGVSPGCIPDARWPVQLREVDSTRLNYDYEDFSHHIADFSYPR